ncbi:MAG: glutamate--tRNA ligase [Candidatus Methylacidiphilales bacterium]
MSETVRVRFAPSPTGLLHIGGARTALFNWLFARAKGGTFVLRIEDTDAARNTPEAVAIIFEGLRWLGLDWDEGPMPDGSSRGGRGPYFQSQRGEIYQRYIERLLQEGKAYEEDGAVKFRTPKTPCTVPDLICGQVAFDRTMDPDLVIRRKNGSPVFHLVNVVDDLEMGITHVIRGEDHLSNTPKHLALFEAFGAKPPHYAHIPLILNSNGSKMSKRDEGASIGEYIAGGYLPKAVRNYLCLLGWSPKDNREILPIEEVIAKFDLPQIKRSNARFDLNKLFWVNGEYWKEMSDADYLAFARNLMVAHGQDPASVDSAYLDAALRLIREKIKIGRDVPEWMAPFLNETFPYDEVAVTKVFRTQGARERLQAIRQAMAEVPEWTASACEKALHALAQSLGVKTAALVHPCRLGVSGQPVGPSLYPMLEVMGRERVLARLDRTLVTADLFGP